MFHYAPAWCDIRALRASSGELVSIHAPAGCDRILLCPFRTGVHHAPAWGATRLDGSGSRGGVSFNSRTRVGCDRQVCSPDKSATVSIHAPRGVRRALQLIAACFACFNSRTAWVRHRVYAFLPFSSPFQFTHPRGATRAAAMLAVSTVSFQFTHPRGCDEKVAKANFK